jgi:hypothetical protein
MDIPTIAAGIVHKDSQQTDGWTAMRKLIAAFRNSADVPKNYVV